MKAIAGGSIAVVLLGLYAYLVYVGCVVVNCASRGACTADTAASFNDVMAQALSVIGGLVSAFIIAELAITQQGAAPAARLLSAGASAKATNVLKWVTGIYVLVWLAAGLAAFLVGMRHPNALPALTNIGQTWLGLAVAAAYAYFGIGPSKA